MTPEFCRNHQILWKRYGFGISLLFLQEPPFVFNDPLSLPLMILCVNPERGIGLLGGQTPEQMEPKM